MKKTIIQLFLIHAFVSGAAISFTFTTYTLFFKEHGITLMEMNLINAIYMAISFFLEVPTGAFADSYGRVKSTVIGSLITAAACATYFFSDNFWQFAAAETICAVGQSLISGATKSWLIDWLNNFNAQAEVKKTIARQSISNRIGVMGGALIGSQIGSYNLSWPWAAASISFLLVTIFVLFWPESHHQKKKKIFCFKTIAKTIKEGLIFSLKRKDILYISLFSAFFTFVLQGTNMYWSIFFTEKGVPINKLGLIFAGVSLTIAAGSYLARLLPFKHESKRFFLVIPQIFTAIALVTMILFSNVSALIILFLATEIGRGFFAPIKDVQINLIAPENIRTTINSFNSMLERIGACLGLLFSGWLAQELSIKNSWLISGIILFVGIILFWIFRKKH